MHKTLQQLHIPHNTKAILINNTCCERYIALLLGKSDGHGVLRSDFEALKGLHCHGGLLVVFKFYKGDTWLCFNHSDFPKSWILLEKHLQHHASGFMGQILYEEYIVWSNCFLCT